VPDADLTGLTLDPADEPRVAQVTLDAANMGSASSTIDFFGDRDAFRFTAQAEEEFTIVQRADRGSAVSPEFAVFDDQGQFLANSRSAGRRAILNFDPVAGQTYYLVAGTDFDASVQQEEAEGDAPTRGDYVLDFGAGAAQFDGRFAVASEGGRGALSDVKVFDEGGNFLFEFEAFPEEEHKGGLRVATGDLNADGVGDVAVVTGRGGPTRLRVFDGVTRNLISETLVYPEEYTQGAFVAIGDADGDGFFDVVVSPARERNDVVVFNGLDLTRITQFQAFAPAEIGGATVAVGDTNGDGVGEIVTGSGHGRENEVRMFDGGGTLLRAFRPFPEGFRGGLFVAAADVDDDDADEIVVGQGYRGDSRVRTFEADGLLLGEFQAYPGPAEFTAVHVGASRRTAGPDLILTGQGRDGRTPEVRRFTLNGTLVDVVLDNDPEIARGAFVG
jgi:hypothetical protein